MLDAIRKRSGSWIVRILLLLLVLSFAVWGIGDVIRGPGANAPVIVAGDVEVSLAEYDDVFRREIERLQPAFGGRLDSAQAFLMGIGEGVASRIATGALLDQESHRLGLVMPDEVIRRQIQGTDAFHGIRGTFDADVFRQTLARAGLSEGRYVAMLKQDLGRERLTSGLVAALTPPDILVDLVFRYRGERRVAELLSVPLPADPAAMPTDEEIEAYWRDHQDAFMRPEYRAISVLRLDVDSLAAEIRIDDDAVRQLYDERRAVFEQPEWRTVEQIVLQSEEAARRARQAVDQSRSFVDAAIESGEAGARVLDLGRVRPDDLPPELREAAFALPEGGVSVPLPSPLGWHLIRVTAIEPGRQLSFEEVRADLAEGLARDQALDQLYRLSNQLQDEIAAGATLEEAAQSLGQTVLTVAAVDGGGRGPDGAPAAEGKLTRDILRAAFATAEKTDSGVVEGSDDSFFVVRVDEVTPRMPRPLAESRADVIAAINRDSRDAAARQHAEAIAEQLKAGTAASAIARTEGLTLTTSPPIPRAAASGGPDLPGELVAELFSIKPGETAIAADGEGYIVARLAEVLTPDPATEREARDALKARLSADLAGDILALYGQALEKRYPVRINREILAERYAGQ